MRVYQLPLKPKCNFETKEMGDGIQEKEGAILILLEMHLTFKKRFFEARIRCISKIFIKIAIKRMECLTTCS